MKYSEEVKEQMANRYCLGETSAFLAKEINGSPRTIVRWAKKIYPERCINRPINKGIVGTYSYTDKLKTGIVTRYFNGESSRMLAEEIGCDVSTIRMWARQMNHEKYALIASNNKGIVGTYNYSDKIKQTCAIRYLDGEPANIMANEIGTTDNSIREWAKEIDPNGYKVITQINAERSRASSYSINEQLACVDEYLNGRSSTDIAKDGNYNYHLVLKWVRKHAGNNAVRTQDRNFIIKKFNNEIAAYIAGLFDGEGSVIISHNGHKDKLYHYLRLSIYNTNKNCIDWLINVVGGGNYYSTSRKSHLTGRTCRKSYQWVLSGRLARDFLKRIFPYLVIKRKQSALAIKFQDEKDNKLGKMLTKDVLNKREWYREEISKCSLGYKTLDFSTHSDNPFKRWQYLQEIASDFYNKNKLEIEASKSLE